MKDIGPKRYFLAGIRANLTFITLIAGPKSYKITCIPVCSEAKSMNEGEISQKYCRQKRSKKNHIIGYGRMNNDKDRTNQFIFKLNSHLYMLVTY